MAHYDEIEDCQQPTCNGINAYNKSPCQMPTSGFEKRVADFSLGYNK